MTQTTLSRRKQELLDHLSEQLKEFVNSTPLASIKGNYEDIEAYQSDPFVCGCCGRLLRKFVIEIPLKGDNDR